MMHAANADEAPSLEALEDYVICIILWHTTAHCKRVQNVFNPSKTEYQNQYYRKPATPTKTSQRNQPLAPSLMPECSEREWSAQRSPAHTAHRLHVLTGSTCSQALVLTVSYKSQAVPSQQTCWWIPGKEFPDPSGFQYNTSCRIWDPARIHW